MDSNLVDNTVNRELIEKDARRSLQSQNWEGLFLTHGEAISGLLMEFWLSIYSRSTWFDLVISCLKYMSTGFCIYRFLDKIFLSSREKKKQKQLKLDEIELQVEIMNSKLGICEAERLERLQQIHKDVRKLSEVRGRVRNLVAADDALRQTLASASNTDVSAGVSGEDYDFAKRIQKFILENYGNDEKECSEQVCEHSSTPDSIYSSLSDVDANDECHLKIIKVTNVYKVAYLKHFIKQKRLRRATRQAILKKKMESIKKMLEEWQKALNTVITRKLSTLNLEEHFMDTTSQEAMGDYSKQDFRDDSCSDSDLHTDIGDSCYDDYNSTWIQNPYMNFRHEYESIPEMVAPKEYNYFEDVPCDTSQQAIYEEVTPSKGPHALFVLPEETSSQIAFEELRREIK